MANHLTDLVAIDFFVVPTIDFKVLYVFVVLAHERREVFYFNVTEHPTPNGLPNKSSRPFLGRPHPAICYAIEMRFMASAFAIACTVFSSKR